MVRQPSAMRVQWNGHASSESSAVTVPAPDVVVERGDPPGERAKAAASSSRWRHGQWTIFASGSSMMSEAPASLSAGIRMLISRLGTTVSTA